MRPQDIDLTKHTREEFVGQARARLEELRELHAGIMGQKEDAPEMVKEDLDTCAIDIQRYIQQADVEIELLEHAEEREWIGMRSRVDAAIGEASRKVERAHELLSNPTAGLRPEEKFSEL